MLYFTYMGLVKFKIIHIFKSRRLEKIHNSFLMQQIGKTDHVYIKKYEN